LGILQTMSVDRFGTEVLETNACWQFLRDSEAGRLAVSTTDHLDIFPINYVVDRGTVVFRTAEGTNPLARLPQAPLRSNRTLRHQRPPLPRRGTTR
jgi:nitroimidazol reductase NimA-like FMN-containing flavoprotein (pyridoxamine 5'-phosphate oxidase superfamily)